MAELPAGTVTFLFTDIEGSTRLLHELGDRYAEVLINHRQLLREAFGQFSGREVETQGDSFFVAFQDASDAIRAAAAAQRSLAAHSWPGESDLHVRMGIHTGEPLITAGFYVGIDVHRAARIASAAWGGQVLLSARTSALVQKNGAIANYTLRELGAFALKDLPEPERLFQLVLDDLPASFPPPRVAEKAPAAAGLPDYSLPPADVPCPYKGLVRFESEDSDLFFGREELVSALVARLDEAAFLAVVGPSGSGKSSLVRAGVVPELERRRESLRTAIIEPGEHPLAKLDATRDADLVVVDQFEEAFTLCRDEAERHAFVDRLLDTAERDVRVIVIVRADFYGHCAAYARLAAALEDRQALIGPMTEEELRRAIDRPAERAGLVLEPGLAEGILRDVVGEPGALPLLSHSLLETWRRRSDRMLTLLGYLQAGGVRGAIAHTAETVFQNTLTAKQQTLARSSFLRLTELGEGTEDTRRRVRLDELTPRREDAADMQEVLRVLAGARLVTIGEGTVEVAHEALIRHWPTLRAWLDEDREARLVHRHLTEAAHEWERVSRDGGALYRGTRLATAADWAELHDAELNELEHEFLTASRQAELSELEATKRRNRRLRILVAALAVFLVGVLLAGAAALVTRSQSISREKTARSLAFASASNEQLATHFDASLLLSLEANRARETAQAKGSMIRALDAARHLGARAFLRQGSAPVLAVAFGPDGSTLAAAGAEGKVVLWDAAHDDATLPTLDSGQSAVFGVAFSPDGSTLAAAAADGKVVLWDAAHDYARLPTLDSGGAVSGVAFSPDGSTLAAAGADGKVRLWDAAHDYARLPTLESGQSTVNGVAFSPDGSTLAAAGVDGKVMLWDAGQDYARLTTLDSGQSYLVGLAFSPDGSTLATAGAGGKVMLWDFFWHDFSDLKARVCGLVRGNLTRAEWETLAPGLPYSTTCPD
jgi:WD40 repeat protein/class 3 adenylate cyclase